MDVKQKTVDKSIPFQTKRILEHMKSRGITITDMYHKYGISRSTLHSILDSDTIAKRDAAMFAYALNLPPSFFGLGDLDLAFEASQESDSGKSIPKHTRLLSYYSDYKSEGKDYMDFLRDYFDMLKDVVRNSENELIILDYLANNFQLLKKLPDQSQDRQLIYDTFHRYYKEYMHEIILKIKDRVDKGIKFNYVRICQIPLELSHEVDDPKRFVLQQLYRNVIAHYEYLYRVLNFKSFKLYALRRPIRPYSFIMSELIIASEYDRIDKNNAFYPDLSFMNAGNSGMKMIKTYKMQLNQILLNADEIRREDAVRLLPEIQHETNQRSIHSRSEFENYLKSDPDELIDPDSTEDLFTKKNQADEDFLRAKHAQRKTEYLHWDAEKLIAHFNQPVDKN